MYVFFSLLQQHHSETEYKTHMTKHYQSLLKYVDETDRSKFKEEWFLSCTYCYYEILVNENIMKVMGGKWPTSLTFTPENGLEL